MPSTLSQVPPNLFASNSPLVAQQTYSDYTILQPNRSLATAQWAVQPTTSSEGMVYPGPVPCQGYPAQPGMQSSSPISPSNVPTGAQVFASSSSEGPRRQYSVTQVHVHAEMEASRMHTQSRELDFVPPNQRPPPARRGPFRNQHDREKTAETRRIGSCIRCRMQRIRVSQQFHELAPGV